MPKIWNKTTYASATQGRGKKTSQGGGNVSTSTINKATYEVQKDGEQFLVTLFKNPVITMEDILLDIKKDKVNER